MLSGEFRKVAPPALAVVIALGAGACGLEPKEIPLNTDARSSALPPVDRFTYDYAGGGYTLPSYSRGPSPFTTGQSCLDDTGYDPLIYKEVGHGHYSEVPNPNLVSTFANGVLTLTPMQADSQLPGASLRLTGFDNPNKYLQPADPESDAVLKAHGCDTTRQTDLRHM